jgi:hypothetical protein
MLRSVESRFYFRVGSRDWGKLESEKKKKGFECILDRDY